MTAPSAPERLRGNAPRLLRIKRNFHRVFLVAGKYLGFEPLLFHVCFNDRPDTLKRLRFAGSADVSSATILSTLVKKIFRALRSVRTGRPRSQQTQACYYQTLAFPPPRNLCLRRGFNQRLGRCGLSWCCRRQRWHLILPKSWPPIIAHRELIDTPRDSHGVFLHIIFQNALIRIEVRMPGV